MRFLIAPLALVAVMCLGPLAVPALALAQGQPPVQGKIDVDINTHSSGGGAWWTSPVWMAIGAIALILLILIIVMASRGSGTTVIKD